jgi:hypothetical protein
MRMHNLMEFKMIEGSKSKHGGLQIMKFKLSKHFHRYLFPKAYAGMFG